MRTAWLRNSAPVLLADQGRRSRVSKAYRQGLDQNPANYVPLSPLTYLERAAYVYPTRLSVVYNDRQFTWAQTYERCRRLASALVKAGVKPGDTVATMLPNVPAMYEAHWHPDVWRGAEHPEHPH